jgi:apolipoprotein N-acyltransferase
MNTLVYAVLGVAFILLAVQFWLVPPSRLAGNRRISIGLALVEFVVGAFWVGSSIARPADLPVMSIPAAVALVVLSAGLSVAILARFAQVIRLR